MQTMIITPGEIVKNGVIFDVKNWNRDLSGAQQLPDLVERLFSILDERKIDYILVVICQV
jgi:hypothetical protein